VTDLLLRRFLAVAVAALLTTASAQYANDPFFDHTLAVSQAFGLERILLRLHAAEELGDDIEDEFEEQIEKLLGRDFGRFAGSLAELDAELAEELREALDEVEEAFEDGDDLAGPIERARELTLRAYDLLIPAELRSSPAFIGAVLADLLLADDGVAEAYEDAAEEELWEYPAGWGALQRVLVLWGEIEHLASDERREDAQEMFAELALIYPSPVPPAEIVGDPEEAEAPSQRLTGIIEEVVDANLYMGRDLGRLAEHLAEALVAPACVAFEAGRDDVATEHLYAVRDPYRKHLRRLLDLIAPEIHEPLAGHIDSMSRGPAPADPVAACTEALDLLRQARGLF
jgi:hypothetical protein